jgi:hypothetical protein
MDFFSNFFIEYFCLQTTKAFLGSLSFDNNGLVKPSCGTVALYDPFVVF